MCKVVQQDAKESAPEREEKRLIQLLSWPPVDTWSASDTLLPRFEAFFSSVYQIEDQTLLLLNDFHRLVGGEPRPAAIDLASSLVPALARCEIQLLGTSTLTEYRQYIEHFAAIECRLQGIVLQSDEELQQKSVS